MNDLNVENNPEDTKDIFEDLEKTLDEAAETNPRINPQRGDFSKTTADLKALLEASVVTNSSLVLDDVLQNVMRNAIDLMQAERGLIMLLDDNNELQVKTAYNLCKEDMMEEDFKISSSIANKVTASGKSIYTSDAQKDDRYANQPSVVELNLRSIMCVPLKVKGIIIGVIYLDNSNQAKMFLKSDLYLFELYAQIVSNALHNASIYDSLLNLKKYNEAVVHKSPLGIIVLDAKGRLNTINAIALEIFDLNRDNIDLADNEKPGSIFLDLIPENEQPRWQQMISTTLATKEEFSNPRFFHSTGYIEKALSVKISLLPELPYSKDGLILTVEDITEKVIMEKYVILSEKLVAKGEMAASIAHELNNFLSIASNNAELLTVNIDREKYDKAKFNSKTIVQNIFKIKRFVDNLMDFAKPETEYIIYDVKSLIEDLLFSLRVQPKFKKIHFTIDLGRDVQKVEIDVGQIQQVLMNLLNNASDAIEERSIESENDGSTFKPEIAIATNYDDQNDEVIITISDNGYGISEENLLKIFNIHFTTKRGGHGLGLSNCKKIVEQHHGKLLVDSTEGKGTTFKMILPTKQPETVTSEL